MHRLLFLSDDWDRKKALKSELLRCDITVLPLPCAQALADDFVPPTALDAVVVDLEGCRSERDTLCRALRRDRPLTEAPLLLLVTASDLPRLNFGWGFDDYLTLPVTAARIAQRLAFLLWKRHRLEPKHGFSQGGLVIDFERYEVRIHGAPADLTYKEFELLKFLAIHPGKPFSREALLDQVWGYDYYGGTRTVDVHVRRLRAKIELGGATYIETVRHVGYKFLAQPPASAPSALRPD